jgi:hypothetical protein
VTAPRERALELLERHITSGREENADPGVTARECLLALEGIGYRPTEARPPADWRLHGAAADPSEETRSALAAVRAACAVSPTRVHPAGGDPGTTAAGRTPGIHDETRAPS